MNTELAAQHRMTIHTVLDAHRRKRKDLETLSLDQHEHAGGGCSVTTAHNKSMWNVSGRGWTEHGAIGCANQNIYNERTYSHES